MISFAGFCCSMLYVMTWVVSLVGAESVVLWALLNESVYLLVKLVSPAKTLCFL